MLICISDILDSDTLEAARDIARRTELFASGSSTAGWRARQRKNNLQGSESALVRGLLRKVEVRLKENRVFASAARPARFVRLILSRYEPGMSYGPHVDDALMDGTRTDLSFTIFLSRPEDYEGGDLIIDEPIGERAVKLPAGSLVLYPTTTLHRVEPVKDGVRMAVVGWVRSLIRDPQHREVLFDLDRAITGLSESGHDEASLDLLLKTRSNLIRMWVEE